MGRRGCRALGKAGILSGWACTLHGLGTAGKGHSSGVTQWDVGGGGWQSWASSFTSLRMERKEGGTLIRDTGTEDVKTIILNSSIQNNP